MNFNFFRKHFNYKKANRFILFLISLDIFFILAHVLFVYLIYIRVEFDWSIEKSFRVNYDGGYPEIFQYIKFLIIIVSIIFFTLKKKIYNYTPWIIIFCFLLLDDAFRFHERSAYWFMEKLNYTPMFGLRAEDLGELTYASIIGLSSLLLLTLGYLKGNKRVRKTYLDIGLLFGVLVFFGVGIDMLHQVVGENRYIKLSVIILEDGGEMISLSFLTWYFYFLILRSESHNTYMHEFLFNKLKYISKQQVIANPNKK